MAGDDEKMRFAVELAVENVRRETGGPFAAAIFELATDRLVAVVALLLYELHELCLDPLESALSGLAHSRHLPKMLPLSAPTHLR